MKKHLFIIILTICAINYTKAQNQEKSNNAPNEEIKVNREYDENGNLIKFDSLYSYSWSGDTTLLKSFPSPNLQNLFGDHLKFFSDSSIWGDSFFGDFDQFFNRSFGSRNDSILLKKFGEEYFQPFQLKNDSIFRHFDEFFGPLNPNKTDSISPKTLQNPFNTTPQSMDEMMKMLQQQMKEMEEHHQKFLKEKPAWKEF